MHARSLRSLFVLGLASLIVACGGAAAPARSPETAPASEGGAAPMPSARANANEDDRAVEKSSIGRAQADFDDATRAVELAGNDCAQLCKALASMSNATERLCALASGDDDRRRCTDARAKLDAARARVRERCPACEPS